MATGWPLPDEVAQIAAQVIQSNQVSNFGLLFQRYLKYPQQWQIEGKEKSNIWKRDVVGRSSTIYRRLGTLQAALQKRMEFLQTSLLGLGYNVETLPAKVVWRLSIGFGTASPLETGLTLHRIHGIPYLPGSAIKGVTRGYRLAQIAEEWGVPQLGPAEIEKCQEQFDDKATPWDKLEMLLIAPKAECNERFEELHNCIEAVRELLKLPSSVKIPKSLGDVEPHIEAFSSVFGSTLHQGDVIFLDALPTSLVIREGTQKESIIELDIINAHYQEYYQGTKPPADSLSPNPVYFLTVRAETPFRFCLAAREGGLLARAKGWLIQALQDYGIGAKTRAGYGELSFASEADKEGIPADDRQGSGDTSSVEAKLAAQIERWTPKYMNTIEQLVGRIATLPNSEPRCSLARQLQQKLQKRGKWAGKYKESDWHRTLEEILARDPCQSKDKR